MWLSRWTSCADSKALLSLLRTKAMMQPVVGFSFLDNEKHFCLIKQPCWLEKSCFLEWLTLIWKKWRAAWNVWSLCLTILCFNDCLWNFFECWCHCRSTNWSCKKCMAAGLKDSKSGDCCMIGLCNMWWNHVDPSAVLIKVHLLSSSSADSAVPATEKLATVQ